jgi:flagellin-specific chaperone FliS
VDEKRTLKLQYNKVLARCDKAIEYMDNKDIPEKERDRWEPQFLKILEELNFLLKRIGEHTPDEVTNGFKI